MHAFFNGLRLAPHQPLCPPRPAPCPPSHSETSSTAVPLLPSTCPPLQDVAVDACTGSGKTLCFVIACVEKLRRLEEPLRKHQVSGIAPPPPHTHTSPLPLVPSYPPPSIGGAAEEASGERLRQPPRPVPAPHHVFI